MQQSFSTDEKRKWAFSSQNMTKTILWKQGRGFADWFRESQYKGSHGRRHGDNCKSSRPACSTVTTSFQQVPLALTRDLKTVNKNNLLVFLSLSISFKETLGTTQHKRKENSVFLMLHGANAKMVTDLLVKSCNSKGKVWATKQLRFNTSSFAQTWWRVLSNPEMQ